MPLVSHIPLLDIEPEKVLSQAFDIVINGNEDWWWFDADL